MRPDESVSNAREVAVATAGSVVYVALTDRDADHLLALAEWALNRSDLDLGPGLYRSYAEEAARKIEDARVPRRTVVS